MKGSLKKNVTHGLWPGYLVFSVLCLVAASITLFHADVRYRDSGDSLLERPVDQWGMGDWAINHADGDRRVIECNDASCRLHAADGDHSLSLRQLLQLPLGGGLFRASVRAGSKDIVPGDKGWMTGRVVVVSRKENGPWQWQYPHVLASLSGSQPSGQYQLIVTVPDDADELLFSVSLNRAVGEIFVDSLSLRPVAEWDLFPFFRQMLILGWIGVGVWVLSSIRGNRRLLPAAVVGAVMVTGMLVDHQTEGRILDSMAKFIGASVNLAREVGYEQIGHVQGFMLFDEVSALDGEDLVSNINHMFGFFVLSLLLLFNVHWPWWKSLSLLFLFAFATEVLQLFSLDRTASGMDILVDSIGIFAALMIYSGYHSFRVRKPILIKS